MRRDSGTGLVHNEKLALIALVELGDASIHAYSLTKYWREQTTGRSLSYSTLYRCLDQLEQRGYISSHPGEDPSGGPTRRLYSVTASGRVVATELAAVIVERLMLP